MSTGRDTRQTVAQMVPRLRPATPASAAGQVGAGSVLEALAVSCRQVDALAAMVDTLAAVVEAALAEEDAHHREQLRVLEERHRRRTTLLGQLADALGKQNAELDEVAHQVADLGPECGEVG